MIIQCTTHGLQNGLLTSADLLAEDSSNLEIVDLLYELEGEIAAAFHVSREFADAHQLRGGTEPLPEDYGEWVHELACCCMKCFEERHGSTFDGKHRWIPTGGEEDSC
ncbi:hypothetical protein [Aeoliella sp.]|uniref:hypothetical protein n=1 Tax=Aeoliella sp. TaxID=2795800 RepID=UPI003CCBCB7B